MAKTRCAAATLPVYAWPHDLSAAAPDRPHFIAFPLERWLPLPPAMRKPSYSRSLR
jgi:hypothetical protein